MVILKNLPKVLFKPIEFYESMEEINWKEGVLILFLSLFISLIVYALFANVLGTSKIILDFGFGYELTSLSIFIGFGQALFILFLSSWFANMFALKLGGTGNLDETIGMFGYSGFLAFPKSLTSIFLIIFLFSKISSVELTINIGQFFSRFVWIVSLIYFIFIIWELWIKSAAISVDHNLTKFKGFASALIALAITYMIIFLINYGVGVL